MMNYYVYCHTNKINGMKYVGITKMKPLNRWANGKGYRTQSVFFAAINEFGWHNFTHEILYAGLTKGDAEKIEVELIKEFDSANPHKGYNSDFGGISNTEFGESHKRNLSNARKGFKMPEHFVETLRIRMTGKGNPMYGRIRRNEPMKTKKPVKCVESGAVYESVSEASRQTGVQQSDISKVCNGKLNSAGGFHWMFAEAV